MVVAAIAALAVALIAGCGSSGDSTSSTATTAKKAEKKKPKKPVKAEGCKPVVVPTTIPGYVEIHSAGKTLKLKLAEIKRGPGTADLDIDRQIKFKKVTSRGLEPVEFRAKGTTFVGVVVTVKNNGEEEVSAQDLAGRFRIVTTDGKMYASVSASDGCAGAAPTLAVSRDLPKSLRGKLAGPGAPIEAGEKGQSVVVFALPTKAKPKTFYSPAFKEAVEFG